MKKILALLLASVMALSLAACGGNTSDETTDTTGTTENNTTTEANPADAIPDTMTSEDGTYELAFVTDVGQLKDKSFNEGTWNGVKLYANENDMSYKYYQPANGDQATDDDRYDAMGCWRYCCGLRRLPAGSCPDQSCHRLPRCSVHLCGRLSPG